MARHITVGHAKLVNTQQQLDIFQQGTLTQLIFNYSSQLCQLIVQHQTNKQLQFSVMPAHSPAPLKQSTIAHSYASSQSSVIQTTNYSSQLCQLIVEHQPNKQLQLSVMPAHSPAPPKQATIALSYASSQSSTIQTSNYRALSYASSQSSTTQTSNYSSQICQLIVQQHPNKQLQLSVMPAHGSSLPNQATTALSFASSQSSTTQTSNHSSQLCQLIVQHHPNKQLQLSVMPAHSPAPLKQSTIALSYASSVQHHPNKQLQHSVMPAHIPAPPKQANIALSYASSQSSTTQTSNHSSVMPAHCPTTQTSNYSSQLCQLVVQHTTNK